MKIIAALLLLLFVAPAYGQQEAFTVRVREVKGDLNKDGLEDLVTVFQDATDKSGAYQLDIYFIQPDGNKKLVVHTTKAIEPKQEAERDGRELGEITINNGVLSISEDLLRGSYTHKFRYQNGHFEMIGYTQTSSDGHGKIYATDFNLSTGIRIEKVENYETDKVISNKSRKVMIRPLPKLRDFEPYQNELY